MDQQQLEINRNEDAMRMAVSTLKQRLAVIEQGGGKKNLEKVKQRGKLTPRERIAYLADKDTPFTEIGAFAAYGMYTEHGGCPAAGTVAGIGYVSGRQCMIVANDMTVKAGAYRQKEPAPAGNSHGKPPAHYLFSG